VRGRKGNRNRFWCCSFFARGGIPSFCNGSIFRGCVYLGSGGVCGFGVGRVRGSVSGRRGEREVYSMNDLAGTRFALGGS